MVVFERAQERVKVPAQQSTILESGRATGSDSKRRVRERESKGAKMIAFRLQWLAAAPLPCQVREWRESDGATEIINILKRERAMSNSNATISHYIYRERGEHLRAMA